jgi:hypothetical protein
LSRYDGLNLPELLDLLHGIVMPDPVPLRPMTPGWLILAGWLLAVLILGARYLIRLRRLNRYRREALAVLKTIEGERDLSPVESAQQIAALLKRTALAAYPRQQVASLSGKEWAQFLRESANNDRQIADAAASLAAASYRPDADGRELSAPARRWIRLHRA